MKHHSGFNSGQEELGWTEEWVEALGQGSAHKKLKLVTFEWGFHSGVQSQQLKVCGQPHNSIQIFVTELAKALAEGIDGRHHFLSQWTPGTQ